MLASPGGGADAGGRVVLAWEGRAEAVRGELIPGGEFCMLVMAELLRDMLAID